MTTATIVQETPAPVTPTAQPIEDLPSVFYGPPAKTVLPTVPAVSPTSSDAGPTATPLASAVSPDTIAPVLPTEKAAETSLEKPAEKAGEKAMEKVESETGHKAAARRLGQEVSELKRGVAALTEENRVLKAKMEGTYEDPPKPTQQEMEDRAEFRGRETASRVVAEATFGVEAVKTQVYDDDSPYKQLVQTQPWLHARVARHPQPAMEAMRVLKEQEFLTTYGPDVTQWVAKIEAELTPRLLKDLETKATIPVTGAPAPTVTRARGSGGTTQKVRSAEELFYGKP